MAYVAVDQHRIQRRHHAVADHRIAAFLEVQVPADMVHNDKILPDPLLQVGDGLVEAHSVEAALLRIGQKAFQVLEGTGHERLAVSLHDRHIDEEVDPVHGIHDLQPHPAAVDLMGTLLLGIDEGHTVSLAELPVAAVFVGLRRAVADPGALHDQEVPEPFRLQIFDDPGHHFGMGRAAELGRGGNDQVRLDADAGAMGICSDALFLTAVPDDGRQITDTEKSHRHVFIIRSVGLQDLISLDHPFRPLILLSVYPAQHHNTNPRNVVL